MLEENQSDRDLLLDFHGRSYKVKGYTVTFKVIAVDSDQHRPHGLDYSLVLLTRRRQRVFAIDNAHGDKNSKKKFGGQKVTWDHQHKEMKRIPYTFISPARLLEDFWNEVHKIVGIT